MPSWWLLKTLESNTPASASVEEWECSLMQEGKGLLFHIHTEKYIKELVEQTLCFVNASVLLYPFEYMLLLK